MAEEASDPVKGFCEAPCEFIRAKTVADTDQGLAIGDLICLDCHRKATMAADMHSHSLDSQLGIRTHSNGKKQHEAMRKGAGQEEAGVAAAASCTAAKAAGGWGWGCKQAIKHQHSHRE
jgi:hypothetical protein